MLTAEDVRQEKEESLVTPLPDPLRYLVVEGAMGLGTSALARLLAARFDARLVLERYEENLYLERYYHEPARWAFQAQIAFLTNRYRQQRTMRTLDLFYQGIVADYAFDKDRIFAELNLAGEDLELYEALYAQMEPGTPRPDLVVFLQGSVERSMEEIRRRKRPYEETIDEEYVAELHHAYASYFFRYTKSPLLIINTDDMDCVNCQDDFEELVHQITKPVHGITYLRPVQGGLFQ